MKNNLVSSNKIKTLPKELSAKIAAGEVIERPLSIVKELVENSIDAGANNITVEIKKGGKEYIRVTDNGKGIEKDQFELAFKRYATSKIATEEDLDNIYSLGFRGEALASIAAVSKIELISKTNNSKVGAKISLEAGEILGINDTACEDGTTIIVKDIFFNLPARQKFLKQDNTENSLIADFLQKMALAYPEIKIRFINNGTILFSTLGKGSLIDAIITLYSPQIARSLVEVSYNAGSSKIYGYTSSAETSKTNKRGQVFFVNGRVIKSKLLESAIEEAYADKLFDGRHPICYLFIELDPSQIDVNVHPSKAEIKFYDENAVTDLIILGIRKALVKQDAAPDVAHLVDKKANSVEKPVEKYAFNTQPVENNNVYHNIFSSIIDEDNIFKELREEQQSIEIPTIPVSAELKKELGKEQKFTFSNLKPVAQVFTTYILATDDKNLYIIDQHAAHERIMYEHLLNKFNNESVASQILIAPILINTTPAQTSAEDQWNSLLTELGFIIENFGPNQYLIKEIPASLKLEEAESFVNSVLDSDVDKPNYFQEKKEAIISASCKAAVKAGDKLSEDEI
ncbi:MAG: DNA mismatch repair endonuclease MutL [Bacillota bacterium]|nr:DNA mismatch repair endonuclease MutL [Bacillota bacterium]